MFLDMVGRADRSQNGGTDDTGGGNMHEESVSVSHDWVLLRGEGFDRLRV